MKQIFNILKYDTISSTNDEAKKILQKFKVPNFTIISTKTQPGGKGQRGNTWYGGNANNLLFSIILKPENLKASEQFYLSKIISLGITDCLNTEKIGFKIKWPNDIYFEDKKICGILIENTISGNNIKNSIIGIGLNINETDFPKDLPFAVSLKNITGKNYDIEYELTKLLESIQEKISFLKKSNYSQIDELYHLNLYKINEPAEFKDITSDTIFKGKIIGTLPEGKLIIKILNGKTRHYGFKEIEFIRRRQA